MRRLALRGGKIKGKVRRWKEMRKIKPVGVMKSVLRKSEEE
jgi:hypothetical protein